jgi:hypothetical protein
VIVIFSGLSLLLAVQERGRWPVHVTCIAGEKNSYMIFAFKTLKEERLVRPKPDGNTTLKL